MTENTPTQRWYREHLNSEHFRAIRKQKWKDSSGRCECCGERILGAMHCHHVSYARLGTDEEIDDIEALCEICHLRKHGLFTLEHLQALLRKQIY